MEVNIKSKNLKLNTETKYLIIVGFVLLFVQSIYAGYSVISVVVIKNMKIDIYFLIFCRCHIASVCAIVAAKIIEKQPIFYLGFNRWEILYFLIFGFVANCLNSLLYLVVIKLTSASYVVILSQLIPIFNIILIYLFQLDTYDSINDIKAIFQMIGVIIGCSFTVAIAYIGFKYPIESISALNWLYATLIGVLNNFLYSLYHTLQSKLFYRNPDSLFKDKPFTINAYCSVFGSILFSIGVIPYLIFNKEIFYDLTPIVVIPILYSSLLVVALGYSLLTWCNRKSSTVLLGASFSIQVVISFILLRIFTDETFFISQYFCCVGVLAGVLVVIFAPSIKSRLQPKKC